MRDKHDTFEQAGNLPIPKGACEIQDLIEYYGLDFTLGNIVKCCYRIGHCEHSDRARDVNKIVWFTTRLLRAYHTQRKVKACQ